jgi:peptidyl-prolyl cis-trans isomerase C
MISFRIALALLVPLTLVAACDKAAKPAAPAPAGERVATVNGKPVSKSQFEMYLENVSRQGGGEVPEEQKDRALDQFIGMQLAADAAEQAGIAKDPKVADKLELARMNVLVDAALQKYLEQNPVQDSELKPAYDAQVNAMPREYHARHILVDDKAAADKITQDLQGGADFAKLAAKRSKDEGSGKSGGDLGWFTLDTMVKPFADAVKALQPGEMTQAPVQSEFGWHVIKLEESRATDAPPFEEVKDQVKVFVQRQKLQKYLDELRAKAKVEKTKAVGG